jgi:HSP20 family protein
MNLTRRKEEYWSPMNRLRDQLNRMFDYPAGMDTDFYGGWNPAVDIHEDKDKLTLKAELPGLKKEDIEVSVHENNLVLCGERKYEQEQKDGELFRAERFFGRFHRSIPLPSAVDTSKITANYRDGVLTVTLPKSEMAKPKQIDVKVG